MCGHVTLAAWQTLSWPQASAFRFVVLSCHFDHRWPFSVSTVGVCFPCAGSIHCSGSASWPCMSASHQAALASRAVMFSRNFRVITRGVKFSSRARAMLVSFHPFRHQICIRKCLAMCSPTLDEPRMNRAAELGIATATAYLASPPLWSHYAAGFRCALWPCGAILCVGAQG